MKTINFLFLLSVLLAGCAKRTVASASTEPTEPPNLAFDGNLRVLSYNIHHANPPSKTGVIDMQAVANVIKAQDPHLVALQEVDVYTNRSGKTLHQAEELGRLTGMRAYFAKAINYEGGEYGVAILSKFPLEGAQGMPLPTAEGTNGEPRIMMTSLVTLPGGKKIRFVSTHLDAQRADTNRVLQITKILELLKAETLPVVIAGDFNAVPSSRVIGMLDTDFTRTCMNNCGFTIPVLTPTKTIDFIAYKTSGAFDVVEHAVVDEKYASDHLPVRAVLKVK
jgi:endonuclease/exonuclease/phosphatase family metal-dependent hydrolase